MKNNKIHRVVFTSSSAGTFAEYAMLTTDAAVAGFAQRIATLAELESEVTTIAPEEVLYSGEVSGNAGNGTIEMRTLAELKEAGWLTGYQAYLCDKEGGFDKKRGQEVRLRVIGTASEVLALKLAANQCLPSLDDVTKANLLCDAICKGSKQHGEASCEPDHEVGDLQDALRVMTGLLGPDQLEAVREVPAIKGIIAGIGPNFSREDLEATEITSSEAETSDQQHVTL